jgi:hypothetical protein
MKKNLTDEKLKEDEIEKTISILWIISNKTNSNKKKQRPNMKEKQIRIVWEFRGSDVKIEEKRDKKKKGCRRRQIKGQ